jgi:glucose dehydrogenase
VKKIAGSTITLMVCLLPSGLLAQATADKFVPVTQKDFNSPDPADWLMLGGNLEHWNYSPLDQINRENVSGLQMVWARQMPTTGAGLEQHRLFATGSCIWLARTMSFWLSTR